VCGKHGTRSDGVKVKEYVKILRGEKKIVIINRARFSIVSVHEMGQISSGGGGAHVRQR